MLPLFNLCVNKRTSSHAFTFSQACRGISRARLTQISARKEAPRLTDPLGAQTLTACLIVKNAGDTMRLYKKVLEAKGLLRTEPPWGTPNYELERRR